MANVDFWDPGLHLSFVVVIRHSLRRPGNQRKLLLGLSRVGDGDFESGALWVELRFPGKFFESRFAGKRVCAPGGTSEIEDEPAVGIEHGSHTLSVPSARGGPAAARTWPRQRRIAAGRGKSLVWPKG